MLGTIIGIKPVNFTVEKTGEVIQGTRLCVIADDIDYFGKSCSEVWIGSGTPLEKKLGDLLKQPEKLLNVNVEFSFKANSKKVAQFDIVK